MRHHGKQGRCMENEGDCPPSKLYVEHHFPQNSFIQVPNIYYFPIRGGIRLRGSVRLFQQSLLTSSWLSTNFGTFSFLNIDRRVFFGSSVNNSHKFVWHSISLQFEWLAYARQDHPNGSTIVHPSHRLANYSLRFVSIRKTLKFWSPLF